MSVVVLEGVPQFRELSGVEQRVLNRLWKQLYEKRSRNNLLTVYYEGHRAFQDLGISVPPQMRSVRAALEWPAKAVSALSRKHVFEGFSLDGDTNPFDVCEVLERCQFGAELAMAVNSAYTYGCAFLTVTAGVPGVDSGPVVVQARSALNTTGLWDSRARQLSAVLAVEEEEAEPVSGTRPKAVTLYLPDAVLFLTREGEKWSLLRQEHELGRVPVEMLVYDPQLNRRFGRSRITREVRYLTDAAVRTMVRSETSAEFFAAPQRWVTGVDADDFTGMDRWNAVMGRVLALTPNEDGQVPSVSQFSQMTMEPHLSMYRQLAQNFCSATNLPLHMVGVFSDNPASAEAMQAAEYALSDEAEYQWRIFAPALRRVVENIVMIRDRVNRVPDDAWRLQVNYTPARYVSPQASSDFIVKAVSAFPEIASTTVAKRRAGFSQTEIDQMDAELEKARVSEKLDSLFAVGVEANSVVE